jgi:hypothetical protein
VKRLLDAWEYWGSVDFLPLVRREAAPPHDNLVALIALAGLRPDEARPRIIEDLKNPSPDFSKEIIRHLPCFALSRRCRFLNLIRFSGRSSMEKRETLSQ